MLRMKLAKHGRDTPPRNRLMAPGAQRAPQRVIMRLAIRPSVVLEEISVVKGRSAFHAHETIRMPLSIQRRDVILYNGTATPSAFRRKRGEKAPLAIRGIVLFVKAFLSEVTVAIGAIKTPRMVRPIQGGNALVQNGFRALRAPGTE